MIVFQWPEPNSVLEWHGKLDRGRDGEKVLVRRSEIADLRPYPPPPVPAPR